MTLKGISFCLSGIALIGFTSYALSSRPHTTSAPPRSHHVTIHLTHQADVPQAAVQNLTLETESIAGPHIMPHKLKLSGKQEEGHFYFVAGGDKEDIVLKVNVISPIENFGGYSLITLKETDLNHSTTIEVKKGFQRNAQGPASSPQGQSTAQASNR